MTNIYIETAGCSANFADSELMAGLLKQAKFEIVNTLDDAYIVILNTCTIKGPTETSFFKRLKEIEEMEQKKLIIVTGCVPQINSKQLKKYPLIGSNQIHNVVEVVEEALNDNFIKLLAREEQPPLNVPRIRNSPLISIIPISRGCQGTCSFCITKSARGHLASYPIKNIVKEMQSALKDGAKEIWLTSHDNGCYGIDLNINLAQLLQELVKIPYEFKIRIDEINPEHLLKYFDQFLTVFASEKIYKYLNLPVQSGSNEILKRMNRNYTVEQFIQLTKKIKAKFPQTTISTDLIVGYPGETDEQHWETLNLIREVSPDVINLSKFWPRPGTAAASLKTLPEEIIQDRFSSTASICQNITILQNEKWSGWEGYIVVDEKSPEEKQWIGRNFAYQPIIVEGNFKLGDIVKAKIKINKHLPLELRGETC